MASVLCMCSFNWNQMIDMNRAAMIKTCKA